MIIILTIIVICLACKASITHFEIKELFDRYNALRDEVRDLTFKEKE